MTQCVKCKKEFNRSTDFMEPAEDYYLLVDLNYLSEKTCTDCLEILLHRVKKISEEFFKA